MELKFRDFDLNTKQMRYFDFEDIERGKIESPDCYGNAMQFTGLKDKNGTDIYTGDILQIISTGIKWDYRVSYSEIDACFMAVDASTQAVRYTARLSDIWRKNPVIIGNIHENPELLN